jgi:probable F420-dependent oxidoreductase
MTRPFRFGVNLLSVASGQDWAAKCRRAEQLGYDVLLVPDHLGSPAPFPTLVAAAHAAQRPRVGTFVLNCGLWHPALLAREVATTDQLTAGRLELGLGTGYVEAEHDRAGLPYGSFPERVEHVHRTVTELSRLLADPDHTPQPVQRPRPPLLVGAGGERMLRLAAAHADIVGFTGARLKPGSRTGELIPLDRPAFDQRVELFRAMAAERADQIEMNLLVQAVMVTDDRPAAVAQLRRYSPELSDEELLALPIVLVGTASQIAEELRERRARHGFSYFCVLEPYLEALAPVIEELRGD